MSTRRSRSRSGSRSRSLSRSPSVVASVNSLGRSIRALSLESKQPVKWTWPESLQASSCEVGRCAERDGYAHGLFDSPPNLKRAIATKRRSISSLAKWRQKEEAKPSFGNKSTQGLPDPRVAKAFARSISRSKSRSRSRSRSATQSSTRSRSRSRSASTAKSKSKSGKIAPAEKKSRSRSGSSSVQATSETTSGIQSSLSRQALHKPVSVREIQAMLNPSIRYPGDKAISMGFITKEQWDHPLQAEGLLASIIHSSLHNASEQSGLSTAELHTLRSNWQNDSTCKSRDERVDVITMDEIPIRSLFPVRHGWNGKRRYCLSLPILRLRVLTARAQKASKSTKTGVWTRNRPEIDPETGIPFGAETWKLIQYMPLERAENIELGTILSDDWKSQLDSYSRDATAEHKQVLHDWIKRAKLWVGDMVKINAKNGQKRALHNLPKSIHDRFTALLSETRRKFGIKYVENFGSLLQKVPTS